MSPLFIVVIVTCQNYKCKIYCSNHEVITANKPFPFQGKGGDGFVFYHIPKPSLVSPLQRERLIVKQVSTFFNSILTYFFNFNFYLNNIFIIKCFSHIPKLTLMRSSRRRSLRIFTGITFFEWTHYIINAITAF